MMKTWLFVPTYITTQRNKPEDYSIAIRHREKVTSVKNANGKYVQIQLAPVFVGRCHHGMACPQVADGGTASGMEGS